MSRKIILQLFLLIILGLAWQLPRVAAAPQPQTMPGALLPPGRIRDFSLLAPQTGWLLLDQQLFATSDNGGNWTEITPSEASSIDAVQFLDLQTGFLLDSSVEPSTSNLILYKTSDGGASWQGYRLNQAPFLDLPELSPEAAYLDFIDPQSGWLVFKRPTSSNFSQGVLLRTMDGGINWERLSLPFGEPVEFSDALNGVISRPEYWADYYSEPARYRTLDGGVSWQPVDEPFTIPTPYAPVSDMLNAVPGTDGAVSSMDFLGNGEGWGLETNGECGDDGAGQITGCIQAQRLVSTVDSGRNWTPLSLPPVPSPEAEAVDPALLALGQGFDKCEIPALEQLKVWAASSPYEAVNLYIGGIKRSCSNKALTAAYLDEIDRRGWTMIPTWVGPQSSCGPYYPPHIPTNLAEARALGVANADAAVDVANGLRQWGQVIYYDLEAFTYEGACIEAAKAFLDGWTYQIHQRGYVAGVYGSPCTSALPYFAGIANVPDAVWIANWYVRPSGGYYYNPDATVWNVSCMANTYWPNHQRLRQYTGGHNETWGGVLLNIDSNAMDGIVSNAYGQPFSICPRPQSPAKTGVILYDGKNYDCTGRQANYGYVWRNAPGQHNLSAFFSKRASSIVVPSGWSARLYESANRVGGTRCVNAPGDADFADNIFDNSKPLDNAVAALDLYTAPNCPASNQGLAAPSADITVPTVKITSHQRFDYINPDLTPIVTLQADIQDAGSGVSHAQFFAGAPDGDAWNWIPLGWDTDGSDGWSAEWDISSLNASTRLALYAFAWDQEGNGAGQPVLHLTLDNQPPTSTLNSLPPVLDTNLIELTWQGQDDFSGIAAYDLQIQQDGGAWQDWKTGLASDVTSAEYFGLLGHSYGFRIRARDKAGNQESYPDAAEVLARINSCTTDSYEPDNSAAQAKPMLLDKTQSHTFCAPGDVDWQVIQVEKGKFYRFETSDLAGKADTLLSIWTSQGLRLAEDDDSGPGLASRIVWPASFSGKVYIRVVNTDARLGGNGVGYAGSVSQGGDASQLFLPRLFRIAP